MNNVIVGRESIICEDTSCYILEYHILTNKENRATDDGIYPMYGFEIKKKIDDKEIESFKIEELTSNKDEINDLVSLLKNNIVTPITAGEVIEDLKCA